MILQQTQHYYIRDILIIPNEPIMLDPVNATSPIVVSDANVNRVLPIPAEIQTEGEYLEYLVSTLPSKEDCENSAAEIGRYASINNITTPF